MRGQEEERKGRKEGRREGRKEGRREGRGMDTAHLFRELWLPEYQA